MGTSVYAASTRIPIDDRALAHLQVVMTTKLRRNEAFASTWIVEDGGSCRRRSAWIRPGLALEYEFESAAIPDLNRAWVTALAASASSPTGLVLSPEPTPSEGPFAPPTESLLFTPERGMAQVWGVKRRA